MEKTHSPRLTHHWDFDVEKDEEGKKRIAGFVCTSKDEMSLAFSETRLGFALCPGGCGVKVSAEVYAKHASRWTKSTGAVYWVVDKVLNEVVAPCACRRCSLRRLTSENYDGLTGEPLGETA